MSINIDYSQDGNSLFENVYITGILDYDFKDDSLEVGQLKLNDKLEITGNLVVGGGSSVSGSSTVGGSLDLGKSLFVGGDSYFTGIGTFADDVSILKTLDTEYLDVNKRFRVGPAGRTLHVEDDQTQSIAGSIGVGNANPLYRLQINNYENSVVVSAGGTVGIATTNPYGWVSATVGGSQTSFAAPTSPYNGSNSQDVKYDWTVPAGVYSISVLCIGGGGGGGNKADNYGGGGAGLGYTTISVTPDQTFEIQVGAAGEGGSGNGENHGKDGGDSWIKNDSGTILAMGEGGEGGGETEAEGGAGEGGTYIGEGGGTGGDGGLQEVDSYTRGAGGGGAAGYSGNGGQGGDGEGEGYDGAAAATNSGGGGGGAASDSSVTGGSSGGGGGGGGTGIFGKGPDGAGGLGAENGGFGGDGGSGGGEGQQGGSAGTGESNDGGDAGLYGGGGGKAGGVASETINEPFAGDGGGGAVRIVWSYAGSGAREYPSTGNLNDIDSSIGFSEAIHGPLKLDVEGSVHISRNIYDSAGSAGDNNWWLKRDGTGIRWVAVDPERSDGIYIQDEGTYIPKVGAAQSFSSINFASENSLGVGTDILRAVVGSSDDIQGSAGLATVFTQSLWGFIEEIGDDSIYRMTNVGIQTSQPIQPFQVGTGFVDAAGITSTFVITNTGDVGIGSTLPQSGLDVIKSTLIQGALNVTGIGTFENDLYIRANNKSFIIENASGGDMFTVTTNDGNTDIEGTLNIAGVTEVENTLDASSTTTAALKVAGGIGVVGSVVIGKNVHLPDYDPDNQLGSAVFGNDNDLRVYSWNSAGYVESYGGSNLNLRVGGAGTISLRAALGAFGEPDDEVLANFTPNDKVELFFDGIPKFETTGVGATVLGNLGIKTDLHVGGISTFVGIATFKDDVGIGKTLYLESFVRDVNNDIGFSDEVGVCKTDYRLASVGTGVSWRPSGVETKNTIWVSMNGCDSNSGLLEGDSKRTIGGAAAVAETGDTIIVRSGVYKENNPIGLRTEVTVSGEDLRLVTVVPNNVNKDVFQVRAGCLIQNMNFAGQTSATNHPNCGAVAFPPTSAGIAGGVDYQAVTGYTALGPANQGPDRVDPTKGARYRSPYVRNCTNFMTGSVGMKINGDYVNAAFTGTNDLGQDLKSMVCDSFTQYNQAGIGVSLTNNAYAQLVSIFTIGCDIAIFAGSGGQCDLTNSNSSFGNFGLKADGIGDVEFTGSTDTASIAGQDTIAIKNVTDTAGNFRKPFDGQGAYFKIDLDNYPDALGSETITAPLQFIRSIDIVDGGSGYNPGSPPNVTIPDPQGPESILPEFSANVSAAGSITSIDVIASGRNFVADQDFTVTFSSGNATAKVNTDPILYTVSESSEPDTITGLTNVTFNEFIPYSLDSGVDVDFQRLSRIITSSHSFEYVGAGTDLNRANPFQGGEPIPENEIVAINGGQVPFTSTDQKGNFRIGEGLTIDQTTSTIRGRDFNRAIQAQLTPLILALR